MDKVDFRAGFVSLDEAEVRSIPIDTKIALQRLFSRVLMTKLVEDSFRFLRRQPPQNERGSIARRMRWSALATSGILQEIDRSPPPISEAARHAQAQHLPKSTFEPDVADFSLGMSALHGLGDPQWASKAPSNFALAPLCLECCLGFGDSWGLVGPSVLGPSRQP